MIPSRINLPPHLYTVEWSDGVSMLGETQLQDLRIVLCASVPPTMQLETLLHEITHIALRLVTVPEGKEELICDHVAKTMSCLLLENPEFVSGLSDYCHDH